MNDDSGTTRNSSVWHWITRRKAGLWWSCGAAALITLLISAAGLVRRRGVLSALRVRWEALQQDSNALYWLVGLSFLVFGILGLVVLWKGPQLQVRHLKDLDTKERFDRENEARRTLATILGGVALLTGGFFTWRSLKTAEQAQIDSQRALDVAREGQITDRFTKAIEQLGATDAGGKKKLEVRLGGIYALERIANESERDHWPIMEVLSTYVRENAAARSKGSDSVKHASPEELHPPADIQAILTVLGRRDRQYETKDQVLDLTRTDLRSIKLTQAKLGGAQLSMTEFSGADLGGTDLCGANLYLADLSYATLSDANLSNAYLSPANLYAANMYRANLNRAGLVGANLEHARLNTASLDHADLALANLTYADLSGAVLREADLENARLQKASFDRTDLALANLTYADLSGAYLGGALNLTQEQIDSAEGDSHTELPKGLNRPESWKK